MLMYTYIYTDMMIRMVRWGKNARNKLRNIVATASASLEMLACSSQQVEKHRCCCIKLPTNAGAQAIPSLL